MIATVVSYWQENVFGSAVVNVEQNGFGIGVKVDDVHGQHW
jgi:hypothetical protein